MRPTNVKFQEEKEVYTDPIDGHLYNETREEGDNRKNNNPPREEQVNGYYEPMENKETMA